MDTGWRHRHMVRILRQWLWRPLCCLLGTLDHQSSMYFGDRSGLEQEEGRTARYLQHLLLCVQGCWLLHCPPQV